MFGFKVTSNFSFGDDASAPPASVDNPGWIRVGVMIGIRSFLLIVVYSAVKAMGGIFNG